jgi:hypothetical protein
MLGGAVELVVIVTRLVPFRLHEAHELNFGWLYETAIRTKNIFTILINNKD